MGLLTETNEQYYAGQQAFIYVALQTSFVWTGNANPLVGNTSLSYSNFKLTVNNEIWIEVPGAPAANTKTYNLSGLNTVSINATNNNIAAGDTVVIEIQDEERWGNNGSYEYITISDVISNFMAIYVGQGKIISSVKRTDVLFHAKRGIQEFSYDTLRSIKSQELNIPPSLSLIIPQDYVNYVSMMRVDGVGVQHPIYPTNNLNSKPYTVPLQDDSGAITQDSLGENLEGTSISNSRWKNANDSLINGAFTNDMYNAGVYDWNFNKLAYGQRYGLNPETSQDNGWFNMNDREGKISFSSNLSGALIILHYISDGLSVDYDMRIPKMAEEAMYLHIVYSLLAGRSNVPEYLVRRYKIDRRAALRNAKIRLSNIKLNEFVQVMRGKSKQIKS